MQAGVYGVTLPISIAGYDLTGFTSGTLRIIPPPGSGLPVQNRTLGAGNVVSPATAGTLQYTIQASDFPIPGLYVLEPIDTSLGRNVIMTPIEVYVNESF